jgi:hypothetical protein
MTKENVKTNKEMTEIEAIQKSPELTEFIMRGKIKDVRKSAIIAAIFCAVLAFAGGFFLGSNVTKDAIPNNIVTIQVDGTNPAEQSK